MIGKDENDDFVWPQNCSAYIESISTLGELTIEFNATMIDKFKNINSTHVDIYLEPSDPQDVDLSKLNFTWKVKHVEPRFLKIALIFEYPNFVSPG